jgi:hypothetical protein
MTVSRMVARPFPGPGLVARVGDLLIVCAAGPSADALLALLERVVRLDGDGQELVMRAGGLLAMSSLSAGVAGITAEGRLAVLVNGSARAEVSGPLDRFRLAGPKRAHRVSDGAVHALVLTLGPVREPDRRLRLDSGIVPGGGLVVDLSRVALPRPTPPAVPPAPPGPTAAPGPTAPTVEPAPVAAAAGPPLSPHDARSQPTPATVAWAQPAGNAPASDPSTPDAQAPIPVSPHTGGDLGGAVTQVIGGTSAAAADPDDAPTQADGRSTPSADRPRAASIPAADAGTAATQVLHRPASTAVPATAADPGSAATQLLHQPPAATPAPAEVADAGTAATQAIHRSAPAAPQPHPPAVRGPAPATRTTPPAAPLAPEAPDAPTTAAATAASSAPALPTPSPPAQRRTAPVPLQPDPAQPFEAVLLIPGLAKPLPPSPPTRPVDSVETTGPMIRGVLCANRHFTDPTLPYCAMCGISLVQLTASSQLGRRPPLGVLLMDNGVTVRLDTDYVIGREPEFDEDVVAGRARPLRMAGSGTGMSRRHLRLTLQGWHVQVVDLQSANGTVVQLPGDSEPRRIPAGTPVTVRPGSLVGFGRRWLRYESHRNP